MIKVEKNYQQMRHMSTFLTLRLVSVSIFPISELNKGGSEADLRKKG